MSQAPSGHGMVEFAVAFPLLMLLSLGMMEIVRLGLQQFQLERAGARIARELSLTSLATPAEMRARAEQLLASHVPPVEVQVRLRTLPRLPSPSPLRQRKSVEMIDLVLVQRLQLKFALSNRVGVPATWAARSHVREARFRPDLPADLP